MELLQGLNASQRQAAQHIEGPLLVLAGPGSGKTRVITHRMAHMIEQGVPASSIVGLTFTNKAAQVMHHRLEQLVGTSPVWLGTFHGFCVRLLRRYARLIGLPENFSIYDVDDAQSTLRAAVKAADCDLTHISLGTLANRISYFKNRLVTPEILQGEALSSEEFQVGQVYPFYQRLLMQHGAVDFDDILMHTANLLRTHAELRQQLDERFAYIMVDEYQDTNLAQYVILRHLSIDYPNLACTGDPDQSIYGWRGASLQNVANLERDYPQLQIVRLEDNYRSSPEILSVADCLIQNNQYRKAKVLRPTRGAGTAVRLSIYPTARSEAEDVADQIAALVEAGDFRFSDFGILYRTNAHSRLIEQALLRRQIPYQLIGGFRFYLRKEIKDLIAYLLLVHNPEDAIAWQRAINTPPRGVGQKTIERIAALADSQKLSMLEASRQCVAGKLLSKRAATAVAHFLKIYDQLCCIVHGPLTDLLELTIELTGYRQHLSTRGGQEQDAVDIAENLDELLAEANELDQLASDEQPALEAFLEFAALQADTDRLKSDRDLVTLMTLHAAKGLEFRQVFILAVEENILPHRRSKDDLLELEEERRLLFVGLTRARDHLQLSHALNRGFSSQGSGVPSSFLMELPRCDMHILDHSEQTGYASDGDPGFDEYFESRPVDWDEDFPAADQVEEEGVELHLDDDCQLPPEEISARLRRSMKGPKSAGAKLRLGSELAPPVQTWSVFRKGCVVYHEKFGSGEIISASGHGAKKSVTVSFFSDGQHRSFRLSHVKLTVEQSH